MSTNIQQIIYELITTGTSYNTTDLSPINTILTPLDYSAILWYDQSCIILKDNKYIKTSKNINKIKSMIQIILTNKPLVKDRELDYLIENHLVEIKNIEMNLYEFTKLFIVNYEDFLLENGFMKCEHCEILVRGSKYHEYCRVRYEECVKKSRNDDLSD